MLHRLSQPSPQLSGDEDRQAAAPVPLLSLQAEAATAARAAAVAAASGAGTAAAASASSSIAVSASAPAAGASASAWPRMPSLSVQLARAALWCQAAAAAARGAWWRGSAGAGVGRRPVLAVAVLALLLLPLLLLLLRLRPGSPASLPVPPAWSSSSSSVSEGEVHVLLVQVRLGSAAAAAGAASATALAAAEGDFSFISRLLRDVVGQSRRAVVAHLLVDEALYVDWLPLQAGQGGNVALRSRAEALAAAASSVLQAALRRLFPWLSAHGGRLSVVPYSWLRVLQQPLQPAALLGAGDLARTVGDVVRLLCRGIELASGCEDKPASVFFVKTVLGSVLPPWAEAVVVLDSDLRLHGDIADLWAYLDGMRAQARPPVIALAAEQQTVYAVQGRSQLNGSLGFNGGLQLQDLEALRSTPASGSGVSYHRRLLRLRVASQLQTGLLLGDQTVYTALNRTAPHLFALLPCQWNRQLCRYWNEPWRTLDALAQRCDAEWRIVHGNCAQQRDVPEELQDDWRTFHRQT